MRDDRWMTGWRRGVAWVLMAAASVGVTCSPVEASTVGKLVVAVIGDDYVDGQRALFEGHAQRAADHLLTYEPYKHRAGEISFVFVWNTRDLGCSPPTGRLIICNGTTVMSALYEAGVSYDHVHVLKNTGSYGGAGGGTISTAYVGSLGPQVSVHEMGHGIGGLIDEYVSYGNVMLDGQLLAQCAKTTGFPTDPLWAGVDPVAMRTGCRYANVKRPSPHSIMERLDARYFNLPSQRLIERKIDYYVAR